MPTISTLTVDVETNTSKFSKGLKVASAGVVAFAAGAVVAVNAASDLAESTNKAGQIFGKSAGAMVTWGKNAADAMGLSATEALDAASNMGLFAQAAGLSGSATNKFAKEMVGLSGDLASFFNTNPAEAMQDLQSGLSGQSEPLRKYGIFLTEAAVNQQAVKMGLIEMGAEMTEGQKVLARQALILQQTSTAQGDFARTSDGLANQQRILSAEFSNLIAQIGAVLIPVFLSLAQGVRTVFDYLSANAGPVLGAIGGWFETVWNAVQPVATIIGGALMDAFNALMDVVARAEPVILKLWDAMQPALKVVGAVVAILLILISKALKPIIIVFGFIVEAILTVITALFELVNAVGGAIGKVVEWFQRLPDKVKAVFDKVNEWLGGWPAKILGFFGDAATLLWDIGKKIISGLWEGMKSAWKAVTGWIGNIGGWIADLKGPITKDKLLLVRQGEAIMGGLQTGMDKGWRGVKRQLGGMNAELAMGAVTGGGGAGATTINIYAGQVVTPDNLIDQIHEGLLRKQKRNTSLGLT